MRRVLAICLAAACALGATAASAEVVYQFKAEPNGVYRGPFALLSFANVERQSFGGANDRMSLQLNLQHYGFFGFGCAEDTGKLYYVREATPAVGAQADGPFGGARKQEIGWKQVDDRLTILEARPGEADHARILRAVAEIRAQRAFLLLGVREAASDPTDALGQVLACAQGPTAPFDSAGLPASADRGRF
jgi:hypothetical protein